MRWGVWEPVSGFGSLGRGQGDGGEERVRSVVVWEGRRIGLPACLWVGREEWTKGYIIEVVAWLFVFGFSSGQTMRRVEETREMFPLTWLRNGIRLGEIWMWEGF